MGKIAETNVKENPMKFKSIIFECGTIIRYPEDISNVKCLLHDNCKIKKEKSKTKQ